MTMQHFTQRNLFQDVTYWAPGTDGATNDFGHPETGNGVLLKGRWEDNIQQVRRPNGEEVTSTTTVVVSGDVEVGGFLALGDYSGATLHASAREVQAYRTIPDLRNLGTERRAYL